MAVQSISERRDTAFLGHPVGLGWLSATEFWERFSYYGMATLLVLYMTHSLLLPGHVEHVLGFATYRHIVEGVLGPLSPVALASMTYGLYSAIVYLTPIAGGFLAERVMGRTPAITLGACLMALGHFLMTFDATFMLALLCLLSGVGFFKGNIVTQVGDLYGRDDPRRADAFQIYFLGIQIAVIASPIICGFLAQHYGWHWGFAVAGIGMLIGLTIYLLGRPNFPPEPLEQRKSDTEVRRPLSRESRISIGVLIAIIPVLALATVGNQQIFNSYLVWGEKAFNLTFLGFAMPVEWLVSLDSIISTVTMVLVIIFWRWWATRWTEPNELTKIILGISLSALGPLALAAAAASAVGGHHASLAWAIAFHLLNDFGFANVFPVGLALYTRASPKGYAGIMVPLYYINLFMGNLLVGWLGGLLEKCRHRRSGCSIRHSSRPRPQSCWWCVPLPVTRWPRLMTTDIHRTPSRWLSPKDAPRRCPGLWPHRPHWRKRWSKVRRRSPDFCPNDDRVRGPKGPFPPCGPRTRPLYTPLAR
ncbi:MAG: peptide MFS transporter [Rhizomicrobium sp.]